jgi:protein ImuA
LSLVAGGAASARSGPAETCSPAKPGGQSRKDSGFLPSQEYWNFPRPQRPTLSELFASHPRDGGWAGFLLAQVSTDKPLLWVQDRMAILESGRIHPPGLPSQNLIHVEARDARDALWAMEEGVRCACLSAVIGELWGDPRTLDFTATRRLAVASERSGTPCWLVRLGGTPNLSGARMRWRIASAQSLPNPLDPRAPGAPVWDAELFRARNSPPGRWSIAYEADRFHPVAVPGDRTLGQKQRLRA